MKKESKYHFIEAECFGMCQICEEIIAHKISEIISNKPVCYTCEKTLEEMTETCYTALAVPENCEDDSTVEYDDNEFDKNETVQSLLRRNKKGLPKKVRLWKDDEGFWHAGVKKGPCCLCPDDEIKYPSLEDCLDTLRLVDKFGNKKEFQK